MLNMLAISLGMSYIKDASERQQAAKESVGTKARNAKIRYLFFFFLQPLPYIDFEGQGIGSSSHYKNVLSHTQI